MEYRNAFVKADDLLNELRKRLMAGKPGAWLGLLDGCSIYSNPRDGCEIAIDHIVFVGERSRIDADTPDDEVDFALLPGIIKNNGWGLAFDGELFEDSLAQTLQQVPDCDNATILLAIDYYSRHDDYYDFLNLDANHAPLNPAWRGK